jgi:hypothetical protein
MPVLKPSSAFSRLDESTVRKAAAGDLEEKYLSPKERALVRTLKLSKSQLKKFFTEPAVWVGLLQSAEKFAKQRAERRAGPEAKSVSRQNDRPAAPKDTFIVSTKVAQYVAHGLDDKDQIAHRDITQDKVIKALLAAVPKEDLSIEELRDVVSDRLRGMFRTLAVFASDEGKFVRPVASRDNWSNDIQYEITDRLPVRPSEAGEFLHALLSDVRAGLSKGKRLGGAWGELHLAGSGALTMNIRKSWATGDRPDPGAGRASATRR